jgi:hypothetical protein
MCFFQPSYKKEVKGFVMVASSNLPVKTDKTPPILYIKEYVVEPVLGMRDDWQMSQWAKKWGYDIYKCIEIIDFSIKEKYFKVGIKFTLELSEAAFFQKKTQYIDFMHFVVSEHNYSVIYQDAENFMQDCFIQK